MVQRQPVGRLRRSEDTPREVLTRVIARLHANEFGAIKRLCALPTPPPIEAWLRVVVRRCAIDYLRESPEYQRSTRNWISLSTLSSDAGTAGPDSLTEKGREVVRFLDAAIEQVAIAQREHGDAATGQLARTWNVPPLQVRRLIDRGAQYRAVLAAVLEGRKYPEIAAALGTTRREVELTVGYLEAFLHARGFAG
jgi:DNA-directed RNA polymerase specialized sigma24 family protein